MTDLVWLHLTEADTMMQSKHLVLRLLPHPVLLTFLCIVVNHTFNLGGLGTPTVILNPR